MARAPKRYPRGVEADDLFPELVSVLISGWGCPIEPEHYADGFRIFTLTDSDMAQIWRTYRRELMTEAARRGVTEPWGLLRFDEGG